MKIYVLNLLVIAVLLNGDVLKRELCPGEQLVLSCPIEGFNKTLVWIKGNENIFINRRHGPNNSQDLDVIVNVSIGVYELKFTNMSQDDIGVYTCLDNSLTVQTFNVTMKDEINCTQTVNETTDQSTRGTNDTSSMETATEHLRLDTFHLCLIICSGVGIVTTIFVLLMSCLTAERCRNSRCVNGNRSTIQETSDVAVELQDVANADEDETQYTEIA